MTTAASGRNRESSLGPWPARRECRPRHEADAGSHNPVQGGGAQRRKQSAFSVFFAAQIGQNILRLCGQQDVFVGLAGVALIGRDESCGQLGTGGSQPGIVGDVLARVNAARHKHGDGVAELLLVGFYLRKDFRQNFI